MNLDFALFFLMVVASVEFLLYRLLASMGFYVGVGSQGIRAVIADVSIFAMVLCGALSALLLFWAVARFINHRQIEGLWWRGILIFISPLYLLTILWSIWTPLSSWVLVASLAAIELTILLVCFVSILRPVGHGTRRLFAILGAVLLAGGFKWIVIDFLQISRIEQWGSYAVGAYEIAQFFMVVLPVWAFGVFYVQSIEKLRSVLLRPHWPALGISTVLTCGAFGLILFIQNITQEGGLLDAGRFVSRVMYQTIGLELFWPLAIVMAVLSFFFLFLTAFSLLLGYKDWKSTRSRTEIGTGLLLVYIAGLQPFSVYQMAMSLLGVCLLAVGVADGHSKEPVYDDFLNIMDELDHKNGKADGK